MSLYTRKIYCLNLSTLQIIELISALLGIIGVWLNAKPNILGWPIGIVSVILAAVVYFESRLFAEFGLQIFYTISGFYGWWKWHFEKERSKESGNRSQEAGIRKIGNRELAISLISGILLTIVICYFLKTNTSADFPWLDSGLAAFSLVGQIWLAKKYIENWLLWGLINMVSIGLYFQKELWFFLVFFSTLFLNMYAKYN
jgi:nicotinamide mononucleotide transporter